MATCARPGISASMSFGQHPISNPAWYESIYIHRASAQRSFGRLSMPPSPNAARPCALHFLAFMARDKLQNKRCAQLKLSRHSAVRSSALMTLCDSQLSRRVWAVRATTRLRKITKEPHMSDLTGSNDPNDPYCRVPERMPNLQREWKARAYAKVNLHLGVGPVREDGFHELSTVFQSVNIYDEITLRIRDNVLDRRQSPVAGPLKITGATAPGVPTDESNLVWKALDRLALHVPLSYPALDVEIHKQIPAAGGMAGGSA